MLTRHLKGLITRPLLTLTTRPLLFPFSVANYQPPPSQVSEFTEHIMQIENE